MSKKNPLISDSFDFINQIEINNVNRDLKSTIQKLDKITLFPGQAIYMFDYDQKEIIYSRGIEQVLGYTESEFDFKLLLSSYHPNQKKLLHIITNALISVGITGNFSHDDQYNLIFKALHKNGHYIPIFRQAKVIETDNQGKMISNISLITDFTDIDDGSTVKWTLKAPEKIENLFKKALKESIFGVFTKQELKILNGLKKGESSKLIANELNISIHTVNTHRRNMMNKAEVKNTAELINFVYNNQIK